MRSFINTLGIATVTILAVIPLSVLSNDAEWRLIYPSGGITLGQGWHLVPGKAGDAYCVEFAPPTTAGLAQDVSTRVLETRSLETVRQHFTHGQDINAKFLFDFTSSYSSDLTFNKALEYKSYSIVARIENSPETIEPTNSTRLQLKNKYVAMLKHGAGGQRQFIKECGQGFVYRRTGGADLSAVTTFTSLTLDQQSKSDLKLGGGGQINGFSIVVSNPEMSEQQLTSLRSSLNFQYSLRGGNASKGATSAESLAELVSSLPKLAEDAPKYWYMDVRSYQSLSNFPKGIPLPKSQNSLSVALGQYLRLRELVDYSSYALSHSAEFEPLSYDIQKLTWINDDTTTRLAALNSAIQNCYLNQSDCLKLPEVDSPFDYEYRVYLPIRIGFTTLSQRLSAANSDKQVAETRIAEIWNNRCSFDPGGYAPSPSLTELVNLCRTVLPPLESTIAQLTPNLPTDIKQATRSAHLRAIRDDRCAVNPIGALCISQAQLQELELAVDARAMQ